jgi:hypothetical protein
MKKQPFISTQQKAFKKEVKENLQSREYLALCDLSENYAFLVHG